MNHLLERLGIELPVIQAPMAGVQGSALAIAVSNAGGLGSLPCAMLGTAAMRDEVAAIRAATTKPFNINFFCFEPPARDAARDAAWRGILAPYYRELAVSQDFVASATARVPFGSEAAAVVEELQPPVVSFVFGLPAPDLVSRVKASGALVLGTATTLAEARWLEARGVDAIVAQGAEAGGHRGMFLPAGNESALAAFDLVPRVVDAVSIPVIAAGGIADADGTARALALGAGAAQVGTAFLLCPESTTSAVHRSAIQSQDAARTAFTNVFTGRPARGIVNRLMSEIGAMRDDVPAFPLAAAMLAPLRAEAERRGSGDFSQMWAGQRATECRPVPAAELTLSLAAKR